MLAVCHNTLRRLLQTHRLGLWQRNLDNDLFFLSCWVLLANTDLVRASNQQPRLYVGMVLILIFAEVLGLYGVIVSILMITKSTLDVTECRY